MHVILIDRGCLRNILLPVKAAGQYWLQRPGEEGAVENIIRIEEVGGKWTAFSNDDYYLCSKNNARYEKTELESSACYYLQSRNGEYFSFFTEPSTEDRQIFKRFTLSGAGQILIGRNGDNTIEYRSRYVSARHARLDCQENCFWLEDLNSTNGTYLNGVKVTTKKQLQAGDLIYISGLKIIVGKALLAINNPDQAVTFHKSVLTEYIPGPATDVLFTQPRTEEIFYRSPRFKREIEIGTVKIDPPPLKQERENIPLIYIVGPSMTMGAASVFMAVYAVINALSTTGNMKTAIPSIVMAVCMVLGSVMWPVLLKKHERKKEREKEQRRRQQYLSYINNIKKYLLQIGNYQREVMNENYITIDECITRIQSIRRNLWERTYGHSDFLTIRIGTGAVPLAAVLDYPEHRFELENDDLSEAMYKLAEGTKQLDNMPITISLLEHTIVGMVGERETECIFLKGMILQLCALHSYDEVKMVFIYEEREQDIWSFTRWLPHIWADDRSKRFIINNLNDAREMSLYFDKVLAARTDKREEQALPYYLVFALDKHLAEKMEFVSKLLKQKEGYGFSLVTLYEKINDLPKECRTVVNISRELGRVYQQQDISGTHIDFIPDIYHVPDFEDLAIKMSRISLGTGAGKQEFPELLTFLEMFSAGKVEHLNILTRWQENNPVISLEAPVGINIFGDSFMLDLHQNVHGPHGLIAGMTGSGKSEFIMTYILSLAVNYHPYEVAFILIDYKGGGMAKAFEKLPHTAGIITNLDGSMVNRSLVSIQSELKRRQAIFNETSARIHVSNIDIYKYQKLYREGAVKEPLQHLFIISDEFAELKVQQPEFMQQLISAARIGRSLGVHLILATQKPAGVVDDQIWSNSRFRICLKVQEVADSAEMLKRPDAAELKNTGRFYLQVGYNEIFETGQSAWTGAPYLPADQFEKKEDTNISVIAGTGHIIAQQAVVKEQKVRTEDKQLDQITEYISRLARKEGIKVRTLWEPPLAPQIKLEELEQKYGYVNPGGYVLAPVIGELDNPHLQQQSLLTLPITAEGNTLVYGSAGSGKTTFLTTVLYSMFKFHSPEELNAYILDFSSEILTSFSPVPHVGDVILNHEGEKILNLFNMLQNEMRKRKKVCAAFGGDFNSLLEYSDQKQPNIIVAIQGYEAFAESYGEYEADLYKLAREGTKYGIYFILTVSRGNAVRYQLGQNFRNLYVLQMNDPTDYSMILGGVGSLAPAKSTGRGLLKTDKALEFQTASVVPANQLAGYMREFGKQQEQKFSGQRAPRVPILPDRVNYEVVKGMLREDDVPIYPVGIARQSLKPVFYDFSERMIHLISYQAESCNFIESMAGLASNSGKVDVIVLNGGVDFQDEMITDYAYYSGSEQLQEGFQRFFDEMLKRNNALKTASDKGTELPVCKRVFCIINGYTNFLQVLDEKNIKELKETLERCQENWNCHIVIADNISNVMEYRFEPWYTKQIDQKSVIWIGNGFTDQYVIQQTRGARYKGDELPDDFGIVLQKGRPSIVKLLLDNC